MRWRKACSSRRASTAYEKVRDVPADTLDVVECAHPLKGLGGGYEFTVPLLAAITSPTTPAPASCIPRPAMAARTSRSGWRMRANWKRAASTPSIPYTVDENGALTDQAPGFTGKRVINDKGEKGDANEAVIKALDRGRHAAGARPAQASIPAFLALEEAGDLPQHAAMVHRDGQGHRRRTARPSPATPCAPARCMRSR